MDDLGLFGQNEELGVLLAWWPLNEDYFTRHHFDCGGLLNWINTHSQSGFRFPISFILLVRAREKLEKFFCFPFSFFKNRSITSEIDVFWNIPVCLRFCNSSSGEVKSILFRSTVVQSGQEVHLQIELHQLEKVRFEFWRCCFSPLLSIALVALYLAQPFIYWTFTICNSLPVLSSNKPNQQFEDATWKNHFN